MTVALEPRSSSLAAASRARLDALFAKIEAFFDRVNHRSTGSINCREGCSDCCKRFSVTRVEADLVAEGAALLDDDTIAAIAARARAASTSCPALDDRGRCLVYAHRPVICRTHGLAIRFQDDGKRRLDVIDACEKNFIGKDLSALPADLVLDQATVSTITLAIDAAHADAAGEPRGERFDLDALFIALDRARGDSSCARGREGES